jgi:hypothetical protein
MRFYTPLVIYSLSLLLLPRTQAPAGTFQAEFDRAHRLLEEISELQGQPRAKETVQRLADLVVSTPQQVETLLTNGLLDLLNTPGTHGAADLYQKLSASLQIDPPDQNRPEVFVYPVEYGGNQKYFIAYNIVYCASCSREWIGIVGRKTGPYEILAVEDSPSPNRSLTVTMLSPTPDGKPRFLVYGTNWGDAHNRLSAALYSFDAQQLKKTWSLTDLPQGTVKITPTAITFSYLTSLAPPWTEKTEVYSILPTEIKLRQSVERPNP